jgi:hypothetical protein
MIILIKISKSVTNLKIKSETGANSLFFERVLNVMEVTATVEHEGLRMLQRYTYLRAEGLARKRRLASARIPPD